GERAEDALLSFRRANHADELTAEQQNRAQKLLDLEAKCRETRSNILRLQAQMHEVRSQLAQQPRERLVSVGQKSPGVDALQAKLVEARGERAARLKANQPDSPELRE